MSADTTFRSALVTGANRGIGQEIARELAHSGIRVVLGSRDPALGERAASQIAEGAEGEVRAEQIDVADTASVAACARRLAADGIDVDILVNNAGLYTTTPLLSIDERPLREALEVNFIGAWRTARAFVPGMRSRGWGRVVNISTGYAHLAQSPPQAGAYGLAKAALNVRDGLGRVGDQRAGSPARPAFRHAAGAGWPASQGFR